MLFAGYTPRLVPSIQRSELLSPQQYGLPQNPGDNVRHAYSFNWLYRLGRHRTSQGTGPPRKPAYCLLSKLLSESELVKRLFLTALLLTLYYLLRDSI